MPFVHSILNIDGSYTHLWSVNESIDDLLMICRRRGIDVTPILSSVKASNRRTEKIVEQLLLHIIFGHPVELLHDPHGAPYLKRRSTYLSISHTPGIVVIATHHRHPVGIDVERIGSRVLRVRERFLTHDEIQQIDETDILDNLIAWTAKEALYKAAAEPDALLSDFTLDPFNRVVQDGTLQLTGHLAQRTFDLSTTFRHEVVITVASERLPDTASPAPANMIL